MYLTLGLPTLYSIKGIYRCTYHRKTSDVAARCIQRHWSLDTQRRWSTITVRQAQTQVYCCCLVVERQPAIVVRHKVASRTTSLHLDQVSIPRGLPPRDVLKRRHYPCSNDTGIDWLNVVAPSNMPVPHEAR